MPLINIDPDRRLKLVEALEQIHMNGQPFYGCFTREERDDAGWRWRSEFDQALCRAEAETLCAILRAIEEPTVGDLLRVVGENYYDHTNRGRVEVHLGELVGFPGIGPTVASVVTTLEDLDDSDLVAVLDRPLLALLLEESSNA